MLENLAVRIREDLDRENIDLYNNCFDPYPRTNVALITCAAVLAHHGLLDNINYVNLVNVDLSTVPTQHLVSLISNVTRAVIINGVSGCDLCTLIDSVKSEELLIFSQCLGREETQALMRAMESHLKELVLCEVKTPDMEALVKCSRHVNCGLEINLVNVNWHEA